MRRLTIKLILALVLVSSGAVLLIAAASIPGFADYYAHGIYPLIVRTVGGLSGVIPLAVAEILIYALICLGVVYILRHIHRPLAILSTAALTLSLIFFLYAAGCGVNYRTESFADTIGLEIRDYNVDELKNLSELLARGVAEAAVEMDEASADTYISRTDDLPELCREAMRALGRIHPVLSVSYPRPKPVLFSYLLSIQQVTGVYSPFTIEALYNRDMPDWDMPHTMCHELSHLSGFMREDDAHFIAYLACTGSDDAVLRYSGYLTGFVYAGRALAASDRAAYSEIYSGLPDMAKSDLVAHDAFWARYSGPVSEAQDNLNDAYLKASGVEEGILSYDRFTLLLLAWYEGSPAYDDFPRYEGSP